MESKRIKKLFLPIDYQTFDYDGRNHVKIFGKDKDNKKICLIDTCPSFMWAILKENANKKEIENLKNQISEICIQSKDRTTRVEKIELHDKKFLGNNVKALKIFATNYKDLTNIAKELDSEIIVKRRGQDLGFITHYIIEQKMNPLKWYEIDAEYIEEEDYDFVKETLDTDEALKLISKSEVEKNKPEINLKALAYDIETNGFNSETDEILMISIYGENFKKVITYNGNKSKHDYVEFVNDEKELLKQFVKTIKQYSPDVLIGYNSDSFDLPFIKTRAKILKTNLPIGMDKSEPRITGGMSPTSKISGISHIDLLKFIRTSYAQYMQSETLSLNDVANEFLGEKKLEFAFKHSSKIKEDEWEKYYEYNLHDSKITLQLFEKFLPDLIEFSKIIKEPLFDVSRNGLSRQIEEYILHNLERFNEIPEKRPTQKEMGSRMQETGSEGAFVFEPKPGLFENLAMFDFTSMHTSIIITHNISKETLIPNDNQLLISNSYESPEIDFDGKKRKYYFKKEPGFLPTLLKELFEKRKQYKEEYKKNPNPITKARSNAFKVLSASAHGYIAFAGARYHSKEASMSILAFVRQYNKETIQKIISAGHKVIYGDTDSVAFTCENKSKEEIKELLKKLNSELPGVMHLELEGFFKRGLWVTTRSGETGAKKKYAMIDEEGKVKIRGFETVRRDWCALARKTQDKVLRMILKNGNEKEAVELVKEKIEQVKERKISKDDVLIRTQLKKPISGYKSISPHVTAAIKLKKSGENVNVGSLIEYYIGETGGSSKLVRDKALLKSEEGNYDIKYYLEKQLLPAVEQILNVFKINSQELIDGQRQENLNKWF